MIRAFACLCWLASLPALAQEDGGQAYKDVSQLSLDDMLNTPVTVASTKASTLRETPGVVTVITRQEIIDSGARDLIDVLLLVPGFSFPGVDVENVVDFGFRGLWAHEGKILLMVDGQQMNDLFYGNNAMGTHFPIEQAQSIEIIRGPGSVIYGGSAELAVINIITRSASELNGVSASVRYGQMPTAFGEATLNVAAGQTDVGGIEGLDVTAFAYVGRSNRSDATYTDFGNASTGITSSFPMAGNEMMNPNFFDIGLRFRDFHARFIYDSYHILERDSFGTDNETTSTPPVVETGPANEFWRTAVGEAWYELKVDKLTVTPRFGFKQQNTFSVNDLYAYDVSGHTAQRWTGTLTARYDFNDDLYAMVGGQYYADRGWYDITGYPNAPDANGNVSYTPFYIVPNVGATFVEFWNAAAFGEVQYQSVLGTFTLGARYEHFHTPVVTVDDQGASHAAIYDSFVPRAAWTKVWGRLHTKLLYSKAFRGPGYGDIALANPAGIRPEDTQVIEGEVGFEFDSHNLVTLNLFDTVLRYPLVFQFSPDSGTYYYFNFPKTGSQGFELEYRAKYSWGYAKANVSYYNSWSIFANDAKNEVPAYAVPGYSNVLQGFPALKATVSGRYDIWRTLSAAPSIMYFSPIYGALSGDGNGNGIQGSTSPLLLVNLWVHYRDLVTPGLDLGVGVNNMLNSTYAYTQPYNSGHAPLFGPRRDFGIRLAYTRPF